MKKTIGIIISLVAVLSLVGVVFAASGPPGSGWYTGIMIQNVDQTGDPTAQGIAKLTAYDSTGSDFSTVDYYLTQYQAQSILPTDFSSMSGNFTGGAIAESSTELRAIVNVTNRYLNVGGQTLGDSAAVHPAAGQYQGLSQIAPTLRFPSAKNNYYGKTMTFYVQNAGDGPTTATATFIFAGVEYTYQTPSFDRGQTVVFGPMDAEDSGGSTPPTGNGANAFGSLTVASDNGQELAGIFLEHKTAEVHASLVQTTRGFTDADADSTLYAPTNKDNYYYRFSGLQVMNVGPGSVNVEVTYTTTGDVSGGCTAPNTSGTDSVTGLQEGFSHTFPSAAIPGDNCMASAEISVTSGSGKILGIISESFTSAYMTANPGKYQESVSSYAFPASSATTLVSLPVFKEDSYHKSSGANILNISDNTASIVVTLKSSAGTFVSNSFDLPGKTSINLLDLRNKPADWWDGTAMTPAALGCTSGSNVCGAGGQMSMVVSSTQDIVVIVNESTYPILRPRIQQDKNNYEGFNLIPVP